MYSEKPEEKGGRENGVLGMLTQCFCQLEGVVT